MALNIVSCPVCRIALDSAVLASREASALLEAPNATRLARKQRDLLCPGCGATVARTLDGKVVPVRPGDVLDGRTLAAPAPPPPPPPPEE